jgi:hypothetical protein
MDMGHGHAWHHRAVVRRLTRAGCCAWPPQLFTHLYATQLGGEGTPPTLTDEQKLHALLWILQLDYPTKETGW